MKYDVNNLSQYQILPERVIAYFLDIIILSPIFVISVILSTYNISSIIIQIWAFANFFIIFTFFSFFIFLYGQTPGKMLMNIIVLDVNGRLPSLQKSIIRSASYFLTSIFLLKLIDIFAIIINGKRRSLRDFVADTIVIICNDKISARSYKLILLIIISLLIIDIILLQVFNFIKYS